MKGLFPVPILLFLAFSVAQMARKAFRRSLPSTLLPPYHAYRHSAHLKVLTWSSSHKETNSFLKSVLESALKPHQIRFGVVIEVKSEKDIDVEIDSLYRPVTRTEKRMSVSSSPSTQKKLRKLVRLFVSGDETLVIVADPRCRLQSGWDETLTSDVLPSLGKKLLTAPSRCDARKRGHFPLLLGSGRKRGGSRPFDTAKDLLQRSVCWCAELTVGRPASMMRWISSLRTSGEEPPFFLWTGPLLVDDPSLERECATVATHHSLPSLPNGGAGLVNDVRSQEAILKFGSTNAAEGFVYFSGVERKL